MVERPRDSSFAIKKVCSCDLDVIGARDIDVLDGNAVIDNTVQSSGIYRQSKL